MNYQEFLEYIKENLAKVMESCISICKEENKDMKEHQESYKVELHKVIKNNGIILDGITIRKEEEKITPNIYLNSYFESYQMGKPLSVIMEEIVYQYQKAKEESDFEVEDITDFASIKNRIVLRSGKLRKE